MAQPKTTADELRAMMSARHITRTQVAVMAGVSLKTVESWLATPGAASFRAMPARHLTLIRALLPGFLAARHGHR